MKRSLSWISTAPALLLGVVLPAIALAAIVPDDFPTIQSAIDAGSQLIEIRGNIPPERIHVSHSLVIRAPVGTPFEPTWAAVPRIQSMDVDVHGFLQLEVHDVRFLGAVSTKHSTCFGGCDQIIFEGCRFDSSYVDGGQYFNHSSMRHCMILGSVDLTGYVQFVGNTVLGGTVIVRADGAHDIRDNYVQNSSGPGMDLHVNDSGGGVDMNTIRGTTDGIIYRASGSVTRNDIANCSGDGVRFVYGSNLSAYADSNTISDCGGVGIHLDINWPRRPYLSASMNGNRVVRSGREGMLLPDATLYSASGNTILDSGGNGLVAGTAASFHGNVIGRSGGDGAVFTAGPHSVIGNTFFSNATAGLRFAGSASADSVRLNISAFNGGAGVVSDDGLAPSLGCNDWFGNSGGSVIGISPGNSDLAVDPLFCELGAGDVHLSSGSPLASSPGCGLIGALGIGCDLPVADVQPRPSPPIHFAALPLPARGVVNFAIPRGIGPSELEVFDITGARRWSTTASADARSLRWDRHLIDGTVAAPGVYFARLRMGDREIARTRIVLTR